MKGKNKISYTMIELVERQAFKKFHEVNNHFRTWQFWLFIS